jgi:hypothetical protein
MCHNVAFQWQMTSMLSPEARKAYPRTGRSFPPQTNGFMTHPITMPGTGAGKQVRSGQVRPDMTCSRWVTRSRTNTGRVCSSKKAGEDEKDANVGMWQWQGRTVGFIKLAADSGALLTTPEPPLPERASSSLLASSASAVPPAVRGALVC